MFSQIAIDDCKRYPGLKALLLRKTGSSGAEAFQDLSKILFRVNHRYVPTQNICYIGDSILKLGHFQNEKDIEKYIGLEYDVIAIEEATTLSYNKFLRIRTCNRSSKKNWKPRMYLTTNPLGVGHEWFKSNFVDPYKKGIQQDTIFVPSSITDNRFIDSNYENVLNELPGFLKSAWRDGDWETGVGVFFENFIPEVHVKQIPEDISIARWVCSMDYGYKHYTCILLNAEDYSGTIWTVDRVFSRLKPPRYNANLFKNMLSRNGLDINCIDRVIAGGDVFNSSQEGRTVADDYLEEGIKIWIGPNDRIAGASEVLTRFGDSSSNSPPTAFISPRCVELIDQLKYLVHNPKRPEDVLKVDVDDEGKGGDDAYDAYKMAMLFFARGRRSEAIASGRRKILHEHSNYRT